MMHSAAPALPAIDLGRPGWTLRAWRESDAIKAGRVIDRHAFVRTPS